MNYKIGDKVKIKTWESMRREFKLLCSTSIDTGEDLLFTKELEKIINNINRVITVKKVCENSYYTAHELPRYHNHCNNLIDWRITDKMIEDINIYDPIHSRYEILDL